MGARPLARREIAPVNGPRVTRRQEIVAYLEMGPWGFDELRRELGLSVAVLESELRHVERTLRRQRRELRVEPAACRDCGFLFRGREAKRFFAPSRCPRCKSERIRDPRLTIR